MLSEEPRPSASTAVPTDAAGSSSADGTTEESSAAADKSEVECTTIFVKVERVRRLQRATEAVHTVKRGEDGSFGLGLSEDNEIIHFYHNENAGILRIGDQVRAVNDVPLVRERLASLLQREFADQETVALHISRAYGEKRSYAGEDSFAALQMRDANGEDLEEWLSDIWTLKTDAVWGTFWELPILPTTKTLTLALHLSQLFSEPLVGSAEIPLASLKPDQLETKWYSLREEDDEGQHDGEEVPHSSSGTRLPFSNRHIEGEMLISTRKFVSNASVSGGHRYDYDSDSDYEPEGPVDHATEPMQPIVDTGLPSARHSELL